jgi:glycosyltransferase involved in cell wall biosynthesis
MNIGFVSTRLAGTDGVSLETAKLAKICRRLGHNVYYCAGELEDGGPPGHLAPSLHFTDPEARWIHDHSFGTTEAPPDLRERIDAMVARLYSVIAQFVDEFNIDLLLPQNALAIPMHIPLGVALTDYIAATGIPALSHNHDFYWERDRFSVNCIPDLLEKAFPPDLPSVRHLVINSLAQDSLRDHLGLESTLLPNIFDFAMAAPGMTDFNRDLRASLGLTDNHLLILQPTRVIARKGIELSIELVRRMREAHYRQRLMGKEPVLVVTHHAGDEGMDYLLRLQEQAEEQGVPFLYVAEQFAPEASVQEDGSKIYSLWDAYVHADFVTYPSLIEGFGNALVETLYFRLPALVNRYDVYVADLAPKGFDLVEIDGEMTDAAVEQSIDTMMDPVRRRRMVETNYEVARQHYSFEAVTETLATLLDQGTK